MAPHSRTMSPQLGQRRRAALVAANERAEAGKRVGVEPGRIGGRSGGRFVDGGKQLEEQRSGVDR